MGHARWGFLRCGWYSLSRCTISWYPILRPWNGNIRILSPLGWEKGKKKKDLIGLNVSLSLMGQKACIIILGVCLDLKYIQHVFRLENGPYMDTRSSTNLIYELYGNWTAYDPNSQRKYIFCDYCCKPKHSKDICWKIYGKLRDWKLRQNKSWSY